MVKDLCTGVYFLELMAYDQACTTLERAIDQTRRLQRWSFERRARVMLAKSVIGAGQLDQVDLRGMIQDLSSMSANLPSGGMEVMAEEVIAEILLCEARLDEALRQAETAALQAKQSGFRPASVSALEVQLRILLRLNRPTEAAALADEVLRTAEEMQYFPMVWRIQAAKAQALTRLGDTAGAAQAYEAAADVIQQLAETIPDAELKDGFLSNPLVSSIMLAAHDRARNEKE
jgi:tetratricopeptide (TPR) repeat protein